MLDSIAIAFRCAPIAAFFFGFFDLASPLDKAALTPPQESPPPTHVFEGRLELRGELGPETHRSAGVWLLHPYPVWVYHRILKLNSPVKFHREQHTIEPRPA